MQYLTSEVCTLVLLLITVVTVVIGVCSPPTSTDVVDIGNLKQISAEKTVYTIDEGVVFSCNDGYGHGYLKITCKTNATWGEKSRECEANQRFEYGALGGVLCASITMVICIVFIICSTKLRNSRKKEEEVEMKIMNAAGATKA